MYRLLVLLILMACASEERSWSNTETEAFARVMVDVHMAQAAIKMAPLNKRDSIEQVYWSQITKIHGRSEDDIKEEIEVLKRYPQQLEKILNRAESIVDSLKTGSRRPRNFNN